MEILVKIDEKPWVKCDWGTERKRLIMEGVNPYSINILLAQLEQPCTKQIAFLGVKYKKGVNKKQCWE